MRWLIQIVGHSIKSKERGYSKGGVVARDGWRRVATRILL
jgi:hypothetical protein